MGSAVRSHFSDRTCTSGAGNGARTRDIQLGRLTLYQLSYSRSPNLLSTHKLRFWTRLHRPKNHRLKKLLKLRKRVKGFLKASFYSKKLRNSGKMSGLDRETGVDGESWLGGGSGSPAPVAAGLFRSSTGGEFGGEWRIRTTEGISQQIYSLPHLTALVTPHNFRDQAGENTGRVRASQAEFPLSIRT